ncbi:MAG: hypothetical protein IJZ21_05365 [Clostridia bacterium]|nr:hypothetical protein [Clostridia bacterium]
MNKYPFKKAEISIYDLSDNDIIVTSGLTEGTDEGFDGNGGIDWGDGGW